MRQNPENILKKYIEAPLVVSGERLTFATDPAQFTIASSKLHLKDTSNLITHSNLISLTSDDHSQYCLLAGRSGGQTITGGTAASNTLTLSSTSNATKGKILFGTSAYDEANNRLGIGTVLPLRTFALSNSTISCEQTYEIRDSTADYRIWRTYAVGGGTTNSFRIGTMNDAGTLGTDYVTFNRAGYVGIGTTGPTSVLHVVGLPVYANNAAAIAGGLTAGAFYRTNGDPDLVCIVH